MTSQHFGSSVYESRAGLFVILIFIEGIRNRRLWQSNWLPQRNFLDIYLVITQQMSRPICKPIWVCHSDSLAHDFIAMYGILLLFASAIFYCTKSLIVLNFDCISIVLNSLPPSEPVNLCCW